MVRPPPLLLAVSLGLCWSHISRLIKVTLQMLFPFYLSLFHFFSPSMAEVYRGLILQYLRITSVSYLPSAAPWLHTSSKYRTSPFLHVHRDGGSERGRTQGENMRKAKCRKSCEVTDTNTIFLSYYSSMNRGGSAQAEEIVWMNEISWQHLHRGWWMRFVKVSASKLFLGMV